MIQNISNSLRTKLNSWKTGENVRHTIYGDYYILDEAMGEAYLRSSHFNPYVIELYFEVKEERLCSHHIGIPPVNVASRIHTIILFPCSTALRILNKRNLAEILSEDKDLFSNFLDIELSLGVDLGRPLSLRRDNNVLYEFKYILKRYIQDLETKIKLETDYPITFEDVEETENLELREQALRKLGYENYIREGFEMNKIQYIILEDRTFQHPSDFYGSIPRGYFNDRKDRIIILTDSIAFLQVKDSSTGKRYFLKVPPDMRSVREAKAWTFGLEEDEYNPTIET